MLRFLTGFEITPLLDPAVNQMAAIRVLTSYILPDIAVASTKLLHIFLTFPI
jgi:hypothetical protein